MAHPINTRSPALSPAEINAPAVVAMSADRSSPSELLSFAASMRHARDPARWVIRAAKFQTVEPGTLCLLRHFRSDHSDNLSHSFHLHQFVHVRLIPKASSR